MAALQLTGLLLVPAALLALAARTGLGGWLSPVVLAYLAGILAGNLGPPLDPALTEGVVTAAVLLGIPLLLFPADFLRWLRLARPTAIGCGLAFLSVVLVTLASAPLFVGRAPDGWIVAGMLVGTYTGSAPNMVAVHRGLGGSDATLLLVTATDLLVAGSFALFLLSPGVRWLGRLLPPFPRPESAPAPPVADGAPQLTPAPPPRPGAAWALPSLGLALLAAALAGGLGWLAGPQHLQLVAILLVSTLGVLGSLSPRVRRLPWSGLLGEYGILVFCVGFGSLADLRALLAGSSGLVLAWTAVVMGGATAVHLLLCRLAGIDRDTALVTLTAAIYGPPFIGPVTANLRNPELLLSGITAALTGLAVGTWLGVGVAWLVRALAQ